MLLLASATNKFPELSTITPRGKLKLAAVPVASVDPVVPEPANVVTTPADVILRILLIPVSATNKFPELSIVIPNGELKVAAVPVASKEPFEPEPANVVTTPADVILRILLLLVSATYKFPELSAVTPYGELKVAAVPVESKEPATPEPANVVTTPADVILRILLLLLSATNKFPELSAITPLGKLKVAAVPVASVEPATPDPAKVDTVTVVLVGSEQPKSAGVVVVDWLDATDAIFLILLFPASATYKLPEVSKAKYSGLLKLAVVLVPSALPVTPVPAIVDTIPETSILRILFPLLSATYKFPAVSSVIPSRLLKLAVIPVPSSLPELPDPAIVVTTPDAVIFLTLLFPLSPTYTLPLKSTATPLGK